MDLEELHNRDDLMINTEELEKEIEYYFNNVTKEQLKEDLEKVGIEVVEKEEK